MKRQGFIYILGNNRPTLYIGVFSNLIKRIYEHKKGIVKGFSNKYKLYKLLLKNWHREWKLNLIKSKNPKFKDLYPEIIRS